MSEKFTGVTFAKQKVTPSDDAIVRRAILPDGILTGCELSYSGSTLTMAAGHLMICGRQIRMPSVQNWAVVDATSGFARLVLTIDLTRTSTKETFDQVIDSIEYASAENGFVALEQSDVNAAGTRYQVAACVVSLGTGGITGIVSKLEKCEVGAGLNFSVVGGLTQPSGPKENTIWVNTDQKITSWVFSAEEPEAPSEGMVWFTIGTSSTVKFNALKKNGIQVYPFSAKQYINGTLVEKTAESYQNGEWVKWIKKFIDNGKQIITEFSKFQALIEEDGDVIKLSATTGTHFAVNFVCDGYAGRTIYAEITGGHLTDDSNYGSGLVLRTTPITEHEDKPSGVAYTQVTLDEFDVVAKTYELKIPLTFTSGYFAIHGEPDYEEGYFLIKNLYIK